MSIEIAPDPYDEQAVAFATELMERGEVMRVNTGTVLMVSPPRSRRPRRQSEPLHTAVMISKLTAEEAAWLRVYKKAATAKRRADNERARAERRER